MEVSTNELISMGVSKDKIIEMLERRLEHKESMTEQYERVRKSIPPENIPVLATLGRGSGAGYATIAARFFKENPSMKNLTVVDVMDRLDPNGAPHHVVSSHTNPLYSAVWTGLMRSVKKREATVEIRKIKGRSVKLFSGISAHSASWNTAPSLVRKCVCVLQSNPGKRFTSRKLFQFATSTDISPGQAAQLTMSLKKYINDAKPEGFTFKMFRHTVSFRYVKQISSE